MNTPIDNTIRFGTCFHIAGVTCPNCAPRRTSSACPHCTPRCPHGFPADGFASPIYPTITGGQIPANGAGVIRWTANAPTGDGYPTVTVFNGLTH